MHFHIRNFDQILVCFIQSPLFYIVGKFIHDFIKWSIRNSQKTQKAFQNFRIIHVCGSVDQWFLFLYLFKVILLRAERIFSKFAEYTLLRFWIALFKYFFILIFSKIHFFNLCKEVFKFVKIVWIQPARRIFYIPFGLSLLFRLIISKTKGIYRIKFKFHLFIFILQTLDIYHHFVIKLGLNLCNLFSLAIVLEMSVKQP